MRVGACPIREDESRAADATGGLITDDGCRGSSRGMTGGGPIAGAVLLAAIGGGVATGGVLFLIGGDSAAGGVLFAVTGGGSNGGILFAATEGGVATGGALLAVAGRTGVGGTGVALRAPGVTFAADCAVAAGAVDRHH